MFDGRELTLKFFSSLKSLGIKTNTLISFSNFFDSAVESEVSEDSPAPSVKMTTTKKWVVVYSKTRVVFFDRGIIPGLKKLIKLNSGFSKASKSKQASDLGIRSVEMGFTSSIDDIFEI